MQIAFANEIIYLKGLSESEVSAYKTIGFTYNRKLKAFECKSSLWVLDDLKKKIKLSNQLEDEYQRLLKLKNNVQLQRSNLNPTALIEPPVKAKLFEHQIRAYNMILKQFEII